MKMTKSEAMRAAQERANKTSKRHWVGATKRSGYYVTATKPYDNNYGRFVPRPAAQVEK